MLMSIPIAIVIIALSQNNVAIIIIIFCHCNYRYHHIITIIIMTFILSSHLIHMLYILISNRQQLQYIFDTIQRKLIFTTINSAVILSAFHYTGRSLLQPQIFIHMNTKFILVYLHTRGSYTPHSMHWESNINTHVAISTTVNMSGM